MYDISEAFVDNSWAAALPGERVVDCLGMTATATNHYFYSDGSLFRRFAWCSCSIANAPAFSPKGEWFAVRAHWKQFLKPVAAKDSSNMKEG